MTSAITAISRLPSLLQWLESRLASPRAVEWLTKAFAGEKGLSIDELDQLLQKLVDSASKRDDVPIEVKKIWNMLHRAAHDRERHLAWYHVEQFRREIRDGKFSTGDVKALIDFVRPRLVPSQPSPFVKTEEGVASDPRRWVIWGFKTISGDVARGAGKIDRNLLSTLSSLVLTQILEKATAVLAEALDVAREIGWISDGRDLTNSFVARVAYEGTGLTSTFPYNDEEDGGGGDPDEYHDGFVPLLRLMTATFESLIPKDADAARRVAGVWEAHNEALFVRLQAYAGMHPSVWEGVRAGEFLLRVPSRVFWKWTRFPEVACLRSLRWSDFTIEVRAQIANRLIAGPSREDLDLSDDDAQEVLLYFRDHEIARVVDSNQDIPESLLKIIRDRRAADADFSAKVPAIEVEAPSVRFGSVPDGDANAFSGVAEDDLIKELAGSTRQRTIGAGDNALAYVRKNRRKVVELLAQRRDVGKDVATVWELVLSYPHDKPEDVEEARRTAQLIAEVALPMNAILFKDITDRLCYWLDATDEESKDIPGATDLWERLLPCAADIENKRAGVDAAAEADLSTAALNVPLGHLISFFLRRCPGMPPKDEKPPLPEPFVSLLKGLQGSAKAILANRMALTMNYFNLAEPDWLSNAVLEPMLSNSPEGIGLWEAFGKYGQVPSPTLWSVIEEALIKHVAAGRLSKEALRRLAEMLVVAWTWTKQGSDRYSVDAPAFRGALGMTSDEVRDAAAWQFLQLIDRADGAAEDGEERSEVAEKRKERVARQWPIMRTFFVELWPLEPAAQSPQSANDFARIPSRVGDKHYSDAVRDVVPFLRPFDVWDVEMAFGLSETMSETVRAYPIETLSLIAACVPQEQTRPIYHLGRILSLISTADKGLAQIPDFRRLSRLVPSEENW